MAFDSNSIIAEPDARGARAAIAQHPRRAIPRHVDADVYKWRHLIENFFAKLKEFVSVHWRLRRRRLDGGQATSGLRFQGARLPMRLIGWGAPLPRSAPCHEGLMDKRKFINFAISHAIEKARFTSAGVRRPSSLLGCSAQSPKGRVAPVAIRARVGRGATVLRVWGRQRSRSDPSAAPAAHASPKRRGPAGCQAPPAEPARCRSPATTSTTC